MKTTIAVTILLITIAVTAWAFQPGTYDMIVQAGEDYQLTAVESNAGTPIDLTGNTYAAQCSASAGGTVFANYSAYTTDPTAGKITVKLSAAQTAKNAGRSGVWWLKRTDSSGLVSYRLAGKCVVVPR